MKIHTKITLLLFLLLALFAVLMLLHSNFEHQRAAALLSGQRADKEVVFDTVIGLKSRALVSFVYDYTYWDEFVDFTRSRDKEWARENIEASMVTFGANAAWTYSLNGELIHSFNNIEGSNLVEIPLPKEAISIIFEKSRFSEFYAWTPEGLMEFHGATVHPTSDPERKTLPRGYFFTARLWDSEYVGEIERVTGSKIEVVPMGAMGRSSVEPASGAGNAKDTIYFSRELAAWDGAPLARLDISSKSAVLKGFMATSKRLYILLLIFAAVTLATFSLALTRWISAPLRMISMTLSKNEPEYISGLCKERSDFGRIALLIFRFFEQKDKLISEIAERRKTEEKLQSAYDKLKEAQEQLLQSAKMASIGLLAGGVAHEINNPLSGVLNNVQLVRMMAEQERKFDYEDFKQILASIEESAQRCTKIIRSLLSFSHQSAGISQDLSLNEMAERVLALVEHELKLQNISIKTEFIPDLPFVRSDPQLLQQAIFDLVTNAQWAIRKKSDKDGGMITVRTGYLEEERSVLISISDTGIGIPHDNIARIFDPFFTTKPIGEGTGLGLAIVYHIAKTQGGSVYAQSSPDEGATFTIKLPAASARCLDTI
ncbi:MAG: ATP-binding protein [Candidatus Omnitrophota bacterium]